MSDRFRVSRLLARKLEEHRISPAAVLRQAGLPPGLLQQEKIAVTTAELFALWRAIGAVSGDPGIGLALGSEPRVERYSPSQIAAICSRSFRDALQRVGRYKRLTCPEEIRLADTSDGVAVEFAYLAATEPEPEILVDLALAWILSIGRRGTDQPISPLRVELMRPAGQRDLLEAFFGCRVRFKARRNLLVFRTADLDRPFVTHNEDLLATIGAQLDGELLASQDSADVGEQVQRVLKRTLAGKRPSLETIAREMGMSERTLQRRLTDAGVTFQQLAEATRRELARHYLGQDAIELQEVAYLLGYEDANSFFRAFSAWEGMTPGEWRERHLVLQRN